MSYLREYIDCAMFFRFDGHFCDVFIEDDHYLFAECTEYNKYYNVTANIWRVSKHSSGETELTQCGAIGTGANYLVTLEHAPIETARKIIANEYAHKLYMRTRGDEYEWYGFDHVPSFAECVESVEAYGF